VLALVGVAGIALRRYGLRELPAAGDADLLWSNL